MCDFQRQIVRLFFHSTAFTVVLKKVGGRGTRTSGPPPHTEIWCTSKPIIEQQYQHDATSMYRKYLSKCHIYNTYNQYTNLYNVIRCIVVKTQCRKFCCSFRRNAPFENSVNAKISAICQQHAHHNNTTKQLLKFIQSIVIVMFCNYTSN